MLKRFFSIAVLLFVFVGLSAAAEFALAPQEKMELTITHFPTGKRGIVNIPQNFLISYQDELKKVAKKAIRDSLYVFLVGYSDGTGFLPSVADMKDQLNSAFSLERANFVANDLIENHEVPAWQVKPLGASDKEKGDEFRRVEVILSPYPELASDREEPIVQKPKLWVTSDSEGNFTVSNITNDNNLITSIIGETVEIDEPGFYLLNLFWNDDTESSQKIAVNSGLTILEVVKPEPEPVPVKVEFIADEVRLYHRQTYEFKQMAQVIWSDGSVTYDVHFTSEDIKEGLDSKSGHFQAGSEPGRFQVVAYHSQYALISDGNDGTNSSNGFDRHALRDTITVEVMQFPKVPAAVTKIPIRKFTGLTSSSESYAGATVGVVTRNNIVFSADLLTGPSGSRVAAEAGYAFMKKDRLMPLATFTFGPSFDEQAELNWRLFTARFYIAYSKHLAASVGVSALWSKKMSASLGHSINTEKGELESGVNLRLEETREIKPEVLLSLIWFF